MVQLFFWNNIKRYRNQCWTSRLLLQPSYQLDIILLTLLLYILSFLNKQISYMSCKHFSSLELCHIQPPRTKMKSMNSTTDWRLWEAVLRVHGCGLEVLLSTSSCNHESILSPYSLTVTDGDTTRAQPWLEVKHNHDHCTVLYVLTICKNKLQNLCLFF